MQLKRQKNKSAQSDNKSSFDRSYYPGLYQSADTASIQAQRHYFLSLEGYLISLLIISIIPFLNLQLKVNNLLLAFFFILSLSIMLWIIIKNQDESWYNGRAVAESVKTRTWRWMMKAEPYDDGDEEMGAKLFLSDLKQILQQNKKLGDLIGNSSAVKEPITKRMKEIRLLNTLERLNFYIEQRINDQSNWYMKKTSTFKKRARNWFIVLVLIHLAAIFFLLYQIMDVNLRFPIETLTVGAGIVISWIQAKKYRQLSTAYSLTVHEITLIKFDSENVKDEKTLSEFVLNSENAFSREHTQWVAKKIT